jgi:PucR family transcriptional regulator, purine catabolism regulatory protein
VGLTHTSCPPGLVAAAQAQGMPLLEVPGATAFIAVSKAVSALLGVEEHEGITRAFEAQRDLTRAALAPAATGVIAARLARHVEGWVLVLDSAGTPLHATATDPVVVPALAGWPAAHRAELAQLRRRGLLASSSMADADGSVSLHPLGVRGRVRGFLAVGTSGPLDRNGQSVVAVAVSLLSLAMEQDHEAALGGQDVRVAALRLLFAGAPADDLPLDLLGWGWLTDSDLRVLVATGSPVQRAELVHRLEAGSETDPARRRLVVDTGAELVVLLPDASAQPDWPELAAVAVGASSAVPLRELARGRTEALQALAGAHGTGVH